MSNLKNINGVLPVADHAAAVAWYKGWIGRDPDVVPDEGIAEWQIADNAWIQVSADADTAGKTNLVIGVNSVDTQVADLAAAGVTASEVADYGFIKLTTATDPAGNTISFVEEVEGYEPPAE